MSASVGITHEDPLCLCRKRVLYLFSQGAWPSVCVLSVVRVSDNTLTWTFLRKKKTEVYLFVCACHVYVSLQKAGTCSVSNTCRTQADSSLFFLSSPAAFKTLLEGRRSGCLLWFECPRGRLHQTKSPLGRLNRRNQAQLSNSMTEMFLALLHSRGWRSSPWQRKSSNKNLTHTQWETVRTNSHWVLNLLSLARNYINCKYLWIFCCVYL